MKANRKFVQADDAVSPVIAVILMVAITVVLAATVFVLVSNIGSQSGQSAPQVVFAVDDVADRLTVTSADTPADWSRLAVRLKTESADADAIRIGTLTPFQNDPAAATGGNLEGVGNQVQVTATAAPVLAAQFLEFCNNAAGASGQFTISIVDTVANKVLSDYTFSNAAAC